MWLDALALLILGLYTGMGAHRGGLASALGLITLGASYAAAIVAATRFGPVLARQLDMAEFLGDWATQSGGYHCEHPQDFWTLRYSPAPTQPSVG